MTKNILFVITALFLQIVSRTAFAAEKLQVIERPEGVYRDSSEFHRIDKKFSLNYIAFGVGPSYMGVIGATADIFIDHNSLIELEYANGRPASWNLFSSYSEYDIKAYSAGVHYKHFIANSFYFRVGGDYRQVNYRYTLRNFSNPAIIESQNTFTGNSVTASVLIGNQWQWDNFTLGCDWIGYALPVTSSIDSESTTGANPDSRYLKDDEDSFVKKGTTMGLRFYLGFSF